MKGYTLEVHRKVYDDASGWCITVKPDADALDLIEMDGGDEYGRIVFPPQMALMLADALIQTAAEIERATGTA